jgi:hypothetical protein
MLNKRYSQALRSDVGKKKKFFLQKMKFINFFLFLWVIFANPGFGPRDRIESGTNPERDTVRIRMWIHNTGTYYLS